MNSITVKLENETGLHARPASKFVEKASQFESDIKVKKEDQEINAKSIMGVLSLGAKQGDTIEILADGSDAEEALNSLEKLVTEELVEES